MQKKMSWIVAVLLLSRRNSFSKLLRWSQSGERKIFACNIEKQFLISYMSENWIFKRELALDTSRRTHERKNCMYVSWIRKQQKPFSPSHNHSHKNRQKGYAEEEMCVRFFFRKVKIWKIVSIINTEAIKNWCSVWCWYFAFDTIFLYRRFKT